MSIYIGIYCPYATILWISRSNTSTISISSITYRCLILCHLSWHITIHSINTSSLYFPRFYHLDDHIDDIYVLSKLWICISKWFLTCLFVNIMKRISKIEIQFLYQTTPNKIKWLSFSKKFVNEKIAIFMILTLEIQKSIIIWRTFFGWKKV